VVAVLQKIVKNGLVDTSTTAFLLNFYTYCRNSVEDAQTGLKGSINCMKSSTLTLQEEEISLLDKTPEGLRQGE
jgi:hypothetical protein